MKGIPKIVVGYLKYFDYVSLHSSTLDYLADKISSSLNSHYVFHWSRKVLELERLTNGKAVYQFTNLSYERFKMVAA